MTWQTGNKGHRLVIYGKPGKWRWRYVSPFGAVLARSVRTYRTKPPIYRILNTLKNGAAKMSISEENDHDSKSSSS